MHGINLFQIIVCILFTVFLYKFYKKSSSLFDYSIILSFYLVFNLILFYPYVLRDLSTFFGIGRGVDLFLYVSIFVLFFIVIQLMLKIQKNLEDISMLNRKLSILLSKLNND